MKIAFNPSTVAALTTPPNNKDITFDLRGQNIFARGVKFCGTDTNTWRDIKINNVSIGSHTLNLRNGSNTTLTNTNGVVTINSTWRPVVDNLTSNSTTSSLSANQGRVLAGLINGKSDSDHNHDGRYVKKSGDTMLGALNFANGTWNKVGDDVYMGDCNIGGQFCIMGVNGTTGLSFHKHGNASIRKSITFDGNTLYMNGSCDYATLSNQTNLLAINTVPNKTAATSIGSWSPISGRYVFHQKWTDTSTGGNTADFGIYLDGNLTANMVLNGYYNSLLGFRVIGATGGFLKANGTIDNSTYLTSHQSLSNYYTKREIDNQLGKYKLKSSIWVPETKVICSNFRDFLNKENLHKQAPEELNLYRFFAQNDEGNYSSSYNYPVVDSHAMVFSVDGNNNYIRSMNFDLRSNDIYVTSRVAGGEWRNWVKLLDSSNYSPILDSRYYTESEVNNLLSKKLDRVNLSVGSWNPRNYHLAADYNYNGGDLSISESGGQIHVSVNGYFWQNEGKYRVLDTSDVADLKDSLTVYQYLSDTDTTWWPLIWGGSSHNNFNPSTGSVYKSHNVLSWQTSSQTLYATRVKTINLDAQTAFFHPGNDSTLKIYSGRTENQVSDGHIGLQTSINNTDGHTHVYPTKYGSRCVLALQPRGGSVYIGYMPNGGNSRKLNVNGDIGLFNTGSIRDLAIEGGIYWNPNVETDSDGTDAASITLVKSGVAGGTTLVLSQMNDAEDTIQFKTSDYAKLYHNSYPILTTQNTYVNNHKGYIHGAEITQVNNSDTVDGWHKDEINRTLFITSDIYGLSSYWAKLWEINLNNQYNDLTITFLAAASYYPSYFSIFSVYLRQNGSGTSKNINARLVELIGNIAVGDTELRLYVNNTTGNCQLWGNVKSRYGTMNLSVLKKAWRTNTDSSNIGTFFSTSFSSVQSLPGDGWYKVGVTQQGVVGAFNPASHTHTWNSITDKVTINEFNLVNAGYKEDLWFNYLPINDRSKSATINSYCFGNGHKGFTVVRASGFIKDGGNKNQLLRADGGIAAFNWAGQSGQPTWLWGGNDFNSYYVYNPSNFRVAYAASAGNAETLGGIPRNYSQAPFGTIPCIGNNGVMEIGRYIDYHYDNSGKYDFSTRLQSTGNYGNVVNLPSASGTLALTSDILNYYWANVKISTSSSTTTSPTVHTLTATRVCAGHDPKIDNSISCSNWFRSSGNTGWYNTTYRGGWYMSDPSWIRAHNNVGIYTRGQIYSDGSIRMGNIRLERTHEINSSDNLLINYGSSTNVSLCQGGGNVGIGILTPTQKLDVRGNIITKGFGIQPYYLSNSSVLPIYNPGDGYRYRCLEIGRTTELSCIIADRAGSMNERGVLIKFNKGYDGQIILLKDLENYGRGNGKFWVMPSGCTIIKADSSGILISGDQISDKYDDGRSRFFVYSSVYSVWMEFLCSNLN